MQRTAEPVDPVGEEDKRWERYRLFLGGRSGQRGADADRHSMAPYLIINYQCSIINEKNKNNYQCSIQNYKISLTQHPIKWGNMIEQH